jgi:mannose-1-phosphate guanylyltransferase
MSNLYTVIMAGGAGTRFWPASRSHRPKQLLPLAGDANSEPLVAATVRRVMPISPPERILVVTAAHLLAATREALPMLPAENFLAEPAARNTAPCIGWAAATIQRRDPDAMVMVLPSDHFVADEPGFRRALLAAVEAAKTRPIATIGITPTRPETGYGYMEKGAPIGDEAFEVKQFIEKPDLAHAETYVASGKHLWNGGMFFFRARLMADLIRKYLPELARGLERLERASALGDEQAALEEIFPKLPSISIDHGVMEKAEGVAVVPGNFGWSDVGSWQSSWELASKDERGNAAPADAVLVDADGNLVKDLRQAGHGGVIALIGVRDLAVVATDDAILVIPRDRAQDVKKAIEILRNRKATDKL